MGVARFVVLLAFGMFATAPGIAVAQGVPKLPPNAEFITVIGPIMSIESDPQALSPAFKPSIVDYAWRCGTGLNTIELKLGTTERRGLTLRGQHGKQVAITVTIVEDEAVIIRSQGLDSRMPTDYWIRCLPRDFPVLAVSRPAGAPEPGWYLTGNMTSADGSGIYAMVLDANGTPVWYRRSAFGQAANVTAIRKNTIAWSALGSPFEEFSLTTEATTYLAAPNGATDFHELLVMPNRDLMMLTNPITRGVDLTALGLPSGANIADCVLQEIDPSGSLVWQWRASDHIAPAESTHQVEIKPGGVVTYDTLHCNSIDVDPSTGDLLVSLRHTDAVYRIDKGSGHVVWKLGGNSVAEPGAIHLNVIGDPERQFHAQHDARFGPDGRISLFDNQSWDANLAARGVVYRINLVGGSATVDWSYAAPDGHRSFATGSFRRLADGTDNVIGWGLKPGALLTEVDGRGNQLLEVDFPNHEFAYRVVKVPVSLLDHSLLRATAGVH